MIGKYLFLASSLVCFVSGLGDEGNLFLPPFQLSKYSLIQPQVVRRWTRNIQHISEEDSLSYDLNINDRRHRLHLTRNRDFLHPNFVQRSLAITGKDESAYPKQLVNCYYHGEVEGYEDSMVALSTCSGLRGVIFFQNESYGIEPMPNSDTDTHFLYRLEDVQSEPATCGVVHDSAEDQEPFNQGESLTSLLRRKRNLPETSYVELVLVVDNLRYVYKDKNETAIREEMVEMANLLDGYYKKLNIRIMLVGLEIFKTGNPFSLEGSAGNILGAFVKWRKEKLLPKIRHDVAQFVIGRSSSIQGVLGMAFVGTVCSATSSGGINVYGNNNLVFASTIVAHEMGHNLGMSHDDTRCKCDGKACIMAAQASSATSFSTCSGQDFERLIQRGGGICLKNQPEVTDIVGVAQCGNGLLEEGEQCDCGTPKECKNKCCHAATCKFTPGSACAHGSCCNNCQMRVSGTPCRTSADTCDLPEYCNGTSAFCPDDYYVMDGLPCQNNVAYCYEGRCQTYDYQCRHLFAPDPATKAADICFTYANTRGNIFGNCGLDGKGKPIKCSLANAMCGKVQCTNVDVNNPPPGAHVSIKIVEGSTCVNADFNLGPDVLDPAYVNSGSPCAKGKACIDFACVNASALLPDLKCDAKITCTGRGVCNDQGHCHCKDGWGPPNCKQSGRGGSVDSGPAQIDYSLRNGLLIFFLLVVPLLVLLILVLLFIFKRESLDPCLKGGLAERLKSGNTNRQPSSSNAQKSTTAPQNVSDSIDYPPIAAAPISDFRYGEQDYWKGNPNSAPVRPPVTRQGPGVPRPIPTKQPPH